MSKKNKYIIHYNRVFIGNNTIMNTWLLIKRTYYGYANNKVGYKIMTHPIIIIFQTIMAIVFFTLEMPIESLYFFASMILISLLTSRDLSPCLLPLLLASMSLLKMYGSTGETYKEVFPLGFTLIALLIIRPIIFPIKWRKGNMFWALFGVGVSITLGGLGALTWSQYFDLIPMFYVFSLGFGMLLVYMLVRNYTFNGGIYDPKRLFVKVMHAVGLMGIFMVMPVAIEAIIGDKTWNFQWSNNVSTFLLFSMPFAFYSAARSNKFGILYLLFGNIQFLSIMFTLSRGGILFGIVMYILCVIAMLILSCGRNRYLNAITTVMIIVSGLLIIFLTEGAIDDIMRLLSISNNEARVGLIRVAIDNFMASPLFGSGLAFKGEYYNPQKWALYWYHSLPFQIIGSLGLVGVAAYGYIFFMRAKMCIVKRTKFNLFCFLSMLGFTLMGFVNPGEFAPVPFAVLITTIAAYAEINNNTPHKRDSDYILSLAPPKY